MRESLSQCGKVFRNAGKSFAMWENPSQCGKVFRNAGESFAMLENLLQCGKILSMEEWQTEASVWEKHSSGLRQAVYAAVLQDENPSEICVDKICNKEIIPRLREERGRNGRRKQGQGYPGHRRGA